MDRECHDKNIDESSRRIRTDHRRQSSCFYYPRKDDTIHGIQKQIWEKCSRELPEPSLKPEQISSFEKSLKGYQMGKSPNTKFKSESPKKDKKCDYFPATCTINLCPSCRNLECNLNGNGKSMTMSYDDPDCNLVTTNRPSICAAPCGDDRNSNKTPGVCDIKTHTEPSQRCISKYTSSPQPTPKSLLPDSIKPNFNPTSSSSFLCKTHSSSTQLSISPKKINHYLVPTLTPNEKYLSPSCQQPRTQLDSSTFNNLLKLRRSGRNKCDPFKKPPFSTRLASTSPIQMPGRGLRLMSHIGDTADQIIQRSRNRISVPSCRFDSKPPLPTGPCTNFGSSFNTGNDLASDPCSNATCDDAFSNDSGGDVASNNQYCVLGKTKACGKSSVYDSGGSGRISGVNTDAGYASDGSMPQEGMDCLCNPGPRVEEPHPPPRDHCPNRTPSPSPCIRFHSSPLRGYSRDRGKMECSNPCTPQTNGCPPARHCSLVKNRFPRKPSYTQSPSSPGCTPSPCNKSPMTKMAGMDKCKPLPPRPSHRPMLTLMWPHDFTSIFACFTYVSKVMSGLFCAFIVLCVLEDLDPLFVVNMIAIAIVLIYYIVIKPSTGGI